MTSETEDIPRVVSNEINFMLYNYENIEKLIEERKIEMIEFINLSYSNWSKAKTQIISYTVDDLIENFETDKTIIKLSRWKKFLNEYIKHLLREKDKIFYLVLDLKYLKKYNQDLILDNLNLSKKELNYIDMNIKKDIYINASSLGLI